MTTLTRQAIDALVAQARKAKGPQRELFDEREPGLRIRAGERATMWSLMVRLKDGKRTRITLGSWPALSIADARRAAQDVKREVAGGVDPNAVKRDAVIEADQAARSRVALAEVLNEYDQSKLRHLRRGAAVRRALDGKKGLLLGLVKRDVSAITRTDIADAVRKRARTAPVSANRSLAYVQAFFNWCVGEEILAANPALTIRKPAKEKFRDRFHDAGELREIWAAANTLGYPFSPLYRLLIALPMRREEIAAMRVNELELGLDDERTWGIWTLPSDRTKNEQALRIPLSPLARSIIKEALSDAVRPLEGTDRQGRSKPNPFVFSTTGTTPVSGFAKGKQRLDDAIAKARKQRDGDEADEPEPMPHWTVHDLRTTFTTVACQTLKVPANVADRCLNHAATATTSKIARIYNQDDLFDERQDALSSWALFLEKLFKGNC